MDYNKLYTEFKIAVPECISFCEEKEIENFIDDTVGIHVSFGMVIVPYILYVVDNQKAVQHKKQDDHQNQGNIPEGHLPPGQGRDRLLFCLAELLCDFVQVLLNAAGGKGKSSYRCRHIVL